MCLVNIKPCVVLEKHIPITVPSESAIARLAIETSLSKQRLKQAMYQGCVWLTRGQQTHALRRASKSVQAGDVIHLYYDEQVLAQVPPAATLFADEGGYSVWYKPYGLYSQGTKWGDHCTITRYAEQHLQPQRPAFTVHRLDRAAQGLILVAHSKTLAATLSQLFATRQVEKRYRVLVVGQWPTTEPRLLDTAIEGKTARSWVRLIAYQPEKNQSLVEVTLETGRKHQIRRHLAGVGFPVVGDRLYGGQLQTEDLQLTACYLKFICPIARVEKRFQLPLAENFNSLAQ
jgi:tRNA pseudouridine32 synthase/23S rRNA pseudouridine746 synthase